MTEKEENQKESLLPDVFVWLLARVCSSDGRLNMEGIQTCNKSLSLYINNATVATHYSIN